MKIKSLKLQNFRSWDDYQIELDDATILIGPNGAGKTNLMEAIWLISSGRSWRTGKDTEAVSWENDFSRISAVLEDGRKTLIEMVLQRHPSKEHPQSKIVKIDGVKKRLLDLLGTLPAVLFSPESLEILTGQPQTRRRFLDVLLSEIDHGYAASLLEYQKVLKERNKLLLMIKLGHGKPDELDFWDSKLALNGIQIIEKRQKAVRFFNKHLAETYESLSGKKQKMTLKYKPTVEPERFEDALVAHRERDIQQTSTVVGPHRDDFSVVLGEKDITTFGSRGEYRTAVLALVLAQLQFIEAETGEKPVLLLDDIFSELDATRRQKLATIVYNQQTIITTTDLEHIDKDLREKAKIIELK